jgi:hypothetical protein
MAQAEPANTTNPSGVTLTRKGERYVFEHLKVPESPEEYFRALATLRKAARDEIERLIDFLDRAAGDPDLELTGDDEPDQSEEPSLGWTTTINQAAATDRRFGAQSWGIDLEQEHDGREPDVDGEDGHDAEPSLGWTDMEARTGLFPNGLDNDVEEDRR